MASTIGERRALGAQALDVLRLVSGAGSSWRAPGEPAIRLAVAFGNTIEVRQDAPAGVVSAG